VGEELRASKRSTSDGMVEGLRLRFGGGRSSQGCLCLGRGGSAGKKVDFFGDGAAEIVERLTDVWRVVVGFVGIL